MKVDIAAIQSEIEQLDEKLGGIQIEALPGMALSDFSIFCLTAADLELARQVLMLATRGDRRRAAEMEEALLARIKKRLLLDWGRREWLRGRLAGSLH